MNTDAKFKVEKSPLECMQLVWKRCVCAMLRKGKLGFAKTILRERLKHTDCGKEECATNKKSDSAAGDDFAADLG